jgi:hypothetical protein
VVGWYALIYCRYRWHTKVLVTEEKCFEGDSVEYGEIPLVIDRWGTALLQVKDQKAGNVQPIRTRKGSKAASKFREPSISIDDQVEEINTRDVTHPAATLVDDDDDELTSRAPMQNARAFLAQPQTPHLVSTLPPPSLVNYPSSSFVPSMRKTAAKNHVEFTLLPAAEISSSTKPPKFSQDIRTAKIERLQAELAALQANPAHELVEDDFGGYKCVDVSMNDNNGATGDPGDDILPEIVLRHRTDKALFQFAKHGGTVQKAKPAIPRVSPMTFYQGIVAPPSARAVKGKQRALPGSFINNPQVPLRSPSSPLRAQIAAYTRDRYLTDRMAGPSHGRYL